MTERGAKSLRFLLRFVDRTTPADVVMVLVSKYSTRSLVRALGVLSRG